MFKQMFALVIISALVMSSMATPEPEITEVAEETAKTATEAATNAASGAKGAAGKGVQATQGALSRLMSWGKSTVDKVSPHVAQTAKNLQPHYQNAKELAKQALGTVSSKLGSAAVASKNVAGSVAKSAQGVASSAAGAAKGTAGAAAHKASSTASEAAGKVAEATKPAEAA